MSSDVCQNWGEDLHSLYGKGASNAYEFQKSILSLALVKRYRNM